MNRTSIALAALFATAGFALSLAPDASATTASGVVHSAVALPTVNGAGHGGGGGGGAGGAGGNGGGGGGGGHGGGQYNKTIAAGNNDAEQQRRRHRGPAEVERTDNGCGSGYYDGNFGCYQPQA